MPPAQRIELGRHIVADPTICHGKPTFKGTRIMMGQANRTGSGFKFFSRPDTIERAVEILPCIESISAFRLPDGVANGARPYGSGQNLQRAHWNSVRASVLFGCRFRPDPVDRPAGFGLTLWIDPRRETKDQGYNPGLYPC